MGGVKQNMERLEHLQYQAVDVLVQAEAVSRCEFHEEYYSSNGDDEALRRAYAFGTNLVKQDKVDGSREEFMDAIKSAYDNSGWECPTCEKHLRD